MENKSEVRIDIENIIGSKNPRLLKAIPRFIISYLKRILHEDELNASLDEFKEQEGLKFVDSILQNFGAKIQIVNPSNLPSTGRFILASNHPLGGLDGMALMSVAGKKRRDIVFPVNDILLYLRNLRCMFIPINKHGKNIENKEIIDKTFASDVLILYFPAGLCSRKQKGEIYDLEWKNTFIKKAKQYQRDIIPVHINGRNSNFFYNFALWRKRLGIKANIEMLYLVDEMYKQNNKNITITFGQPVSYKTFDKRFKLTEWAGLLKLHVYELGKNSEKEFLYKPISEN